MLLRPLAQVTPGLGGGGGGGVRVLPSNKLDLDWIYYNGSLSLFNRVTRMGLYTFGDWE